MSARVTTFEDEETTVVQYEVCMLVTAFEDDKSTTMQSACVRSASLLLCSELSLFFVVFLFLFFEGGGEGIVCFFFIAEDKQHIQTEISAKMRADMYPRSSFQS